MLLLIAGLVVFLGIHSVSIVAPAWRNGMAAKLGDVPWKLVYGVISLVGFILIVRGYAAARLDPVVLWVPPAGLRPVTMLLMLPVFVLLVATYVPGRIKTLARHPMLLAVKFWALAHLLANGMLADLLLFGGFLAWAVADRISVKRREPRATPSLPASKLNDVIAVVLGLGLYVAFALWLHPRWIGVSIMG